MTALSRWSRFGVVYDTQVDFLDLRFVLVRHHAQ